MLLKGDSSLPMGLTYSTYRISGVSAAGFYPQALGDDYREKGSDFHHPTACLTRWGIGYTHPPHMGGSTGSSNCQIGRVVPNSTRLSTVFRELSTVGCGNRIQNWPAKPYIWGVTYAPGLHPKESVWDVQDFGCVRGVAAHTTKIWKFPGLR
jgi:hypothetical protein